MLQIYTTNSCAYCPMVKKYLTMKGAEYEVINLDDYPERRAEAIKMSGAMTVPITTNGKSVVVGYNPSKLAGLL